MKVTAKITFEVDEDSYTLDEGETLLDYIKENASDVIQDSDTQITACEDISEAKE